jgi:hypothetical protein
MGRLVLLRAESPYFEKVSNSSSKVEVLHARDELGTSGLKITDGWRSWGSGAEHDVVAWLGKVGGNRCGIGNIVGLCKVNSCFGGEQCLVKAAGAVPEQDNCLERLGVVDGFTQIGIINVSIIASHDENEARFAKAFNCRYDAERVTSECVVYKGSLFYFTDNVLA